VGRRRRRDKHLFLSSNKANDAVTVVVRQLERGRGRGSAKRGKKKIFLLGQKKVAEGFDSSLQTGFKIASVLIEAGRKQSRKGFMRRVNFLSGGWRRSKNKVERRDPYKVQEFRPERLD